ncbi:MAG: D-2-hydroxyacid dehydrogenase [Lentisphaeria bacterium]
MKKIVVLDGYALNPGDLSWKRLEQLGDCVVYDRTTAAQVFDRAKDAEFLLINKIMMSREVMEQLPSLKYIGVLATGYNVVDIQAAKERNITVTNIPIYGTVSVAQMVFAHLLNLTEHVAEHSQLVSSGKWEKSPDFCFWDFPMIELQNLTFGIVGYGRIGKQTAKIAKAFGMKVLVYSRHQDNNEDVTFVGLEELFKNSDVVSLHCPLTGENEKFVNKDMLSFMKKTAFLINTSRGQLIDEGALADALNSGSIAGAGLDVLSVEPVQNKNPLLKAKNCYITPHIAWATISARSRLMNTAVENLAAFMKGQPQNTVH